MADAPFNVKSPSPEEPAPKNNVGATEDLNKEMHMSASAGLIEGNDRRNDCVVCEIRGRDPFITTARACLDAGGRVTAKGVPCALTRDTRSLVPCKVGAADTFFTTPEHAEHLQQAPWTMTIVPQKNGNPKE